MENRPMDRVGGEEGQGRCMERVTQKFTIACVKQNLLYDVGNSNRGSQQAEGGCREGDGSGIWGRDNMGIPMADSC